MTKNIFNLINDLDNAAKIPALRAVVHTAMSRTIGSIRQHLRAQDRIKRDEQADDDHIVAGLDQRNGTDENTRSIAELQDAAGFTVDMPPMQLASAWHQLYTEALEALNGKITNRFDAPLDLDSMIKFMTERSQPLDEATVKALAEVIKCDEKTIREMHELQDRQDRERMKAMAPAIKAIFEGLTVNPHDFAEFNNDDAFDGWDRLPMVAKHQLGIKLVEALTKAKNQVMLRVMRSRKLTDLGSIPLIDDGVKQVTEWVEAFETEHSAAIGEAIEAGVFLRTLDDVRA